MSVCGCKSWEIGNDTIIICTDNGSIGSALDGKFLALTVSLGVKWVGNGNAVLICVLCYVCSCMYAGDES